MFLAYNLALTAFALVAVPYYLVRAWLRGQTWRSLPERLGRLPRTLPQTDSNSIWLHAVSVGEVLCAAELIKRLRQRLPRAPLFLSTTTVTGQQLAREKLGAAVDGIFYAPLDLPFAVRRTLRRLRPRLVVVLETEIWPNVFREAKRFGAALMIVNGRISDKAAPSYARYRFLFSGVLAQADRILVQSSLDGERFIAAGALRNKTVVAGNLKYDFEPGSASLAAELQQFLFQLRPSPLLVAGSTREQEEELLLDAFRAIANRHPRALLVVAPRHPQRFDEVARLLAAGGLPFVRRSELGTGPDRELALPGVLLLDSLGELSAVYPAADLVFMGGSLNGWGGHNVLEPALYARPVVAGPYMQNFRAIAAELLASDAMVQVEHARQLPSVFGDLLADPQKAAAIGSRAKQVAASLRGASERAAGEAERLYRQALPHMPPRLFERLLLGPAALLWGAAARLRLFAYQQRWLTTRRLEAFTLCVGNLTAGGAGKTPAVAWLTEQLHERGHRVGVLVRGYRRAAAGSDQIVAPGTSISIAESGDEAQILLREFQRRGLAAPLGIGARRWQVGTKLEQGQPPGAPLDLVLLDDGFQHLALARDLDVVLIDVTRPFGGGHLMPLGRLREPLSSLRRAGVILLTRCRPDHDYSALEQRLRALNPSAPVFYSSIQPVAAVDAHTGSETPLADLRGRRIVAFCGVGNPDSFWRALQDAGLTVVERRGFRDHHLYSQNDFAGLIRAAEKHQADLLMTTEKDLINLWQAAGDDAGSNDLDRSVARLFEPLPLCWLRVATHVEQGADLLTAIEAKLSGSSRTQARPPVAAARPG